jgi:peptide/nickel transport system ATP-binding protein
MGAADGDTESVGRGEGPIDRGDPIVEIRDLEVSFDLSRGQSKVVRNVDMDLYRHETLGVVGESGSGKSMLAMSMLDAIVEPGRVSGDVTYYPRNGEPVSVLDLSPDELRKFRWEEIAMVFQGAMSSFNPVTSIRTHFRETLQDHDYNVKAGMERAEHILEQLYLDPDRVMDAYSHELSGGMKQRALIALSLVLEPEVLVLDEPTAALDLLMQRSIVSLLRDIQEEFDLTMLFITHDLPLLTKLADRMAVMYAFDFVEVADTQDILYNASHPYTRALLGTTPDLDTAVEDIQKIEGSKPDPVQHISGCSYHPRCPIADQQCSATEPELFDVGEDHQASCFYPELAREEVVIRSQPPERPTGGVVDEQ